MCPVTQSGISLPSRWPIFRLLVSNHVNNERRALMKTLKIIFRLLSALSFGTSVSGYKNQEISLPTLGLASTECQKMPFSILEHRLMQRSFTFPPGKDRRASRKGVFAYQKAGQVNLAKCAS